MLKNILLLTLFVHCCVATNLLFFMTDDFNILDSPLQSQLLNRLKTTSIRYTNAVASVPVCLPSRSAILFGIGGHKSNITKNSQSYIDTYPDHVSLPELMQNNGYQVGIYGKIFHPTEQEKLNGKFSNMYTLIPDSKGYPNTYYKLSIDKDSQVTEKVTGFGYRDILNLTDQSVDQNTFSKAKTFIDNVNQPFALFFGVYKPHAPYTFKYEDNVNQTEIDKLYNISLSFNYSKDSIPKDNNELCYKQLRDSGYLRNFINGYYRAGMTGLNVMEDVYQALNSRGLLDDTIIVYVSDHGFHVGDNNRWAKHDMFQMTNRVPMMISLPNREASECKRWASSSSLYYTLTRLLGIPLPKQDISKYNLIKCPVYPSITLLSEKRGSLYYKKYQCQIDDGEIKVYGKNDIYNQHPLDLNLTSYCTEEYQKRVLLP